MAVRWSVRNATRYSSCSQPSDLKRRFSRLEVRPAVLYLGVVDRTSIPRNPPFQGSQVSAQTLIVLLVRAEISPGTSVDINANE